MSGPFYYDGLVGDLRNRDRSRGPSPLTKKRLEARAADAIEALLYVLKDIAKQHIGDEIEDPEHADWQGGYEECVKRARAAVSK